MTDPSTAPAGTSRKLLAKRRNERLKLFASAIDRLSTVTLAGAVLSPMFQEHRPALTAIYWIVGAIVLHLIGQFALGRLHEE